MPERNLIIIHRGPEYVRDFTEIAARISTIEPSISAFCIDSKTARVMADDAWKRPTLTVALMSRFNAHIRRGPVLANRAIHKTGQYRIFMQAGLPTPPTERFTPGAKLDPIMFGEYVVIKPTSPDLASYGRGVQLFRRRRLETMTLADFPRDHLIHRDRNGFIVQRFIDTGSLIPYTRLMVLFGVPLSCWSTKERVPRIPLGGADEEIEKLRITSNTGDLLDRFPCSDLDVLALAPRVGAAFPTLPVLGIDVIREERTGKLFILEVNPGGNVWHFSSRALAEIRQELGGASLVGAKKGELLGRQVMIDQFDAFGRAAEVLVQKVRELAA